MLLGYRYVSSQARGIKPRVKGVEGVKHGERREGRQESLSGDEIAAICRRAFGTGGQWAGVRELGGGTVNTTYRLDVAGEPACVLRVGPSPEVAAAGPSWLTATKLRQEHALTPYLAPIAPLLPRTRAVDFTRQLVNRDWMIQTLVPGTPWSELDDRLTPAERADLWRQLGTVARSIHAVEGAAFGPPDRPVLLWSEVVRDDVGGLLQDWQRFNLPQPETISHVATVVDRNREKLDAVGSPRLVHSDLYPRHVFVERDTGGRWRICGLIDHEYGRFADPAAESLLMLLAYQPPPESTAFFDTYGPLPDDESAPWRTRVYGAVALGWAAADCAHLGDVVTLNHMLSDVYAVIEDIVRRTD